MKRFLRSIGIVWGWRAVLFLAAGGVGLFAVVVGLQHALVPELEPSRHTLSEYANAEYGWAMVVGFAAWAASLAATASLVRRPGTLLGTHGRRTVAALLLVAACGLLLTAVFRTQTSAGTLPPGVQRSVEGRLHDAASGVALLALFTSTATVAVGVRHSLIGRVTLALLVLAFATSAVLLAVGPPVDGIRQRALLTIAIVWQVAMLRALTRSPQSAPAELERAASSR